MSTEQPKRRGSAETGTQSASAKRRSDGDGEVVARAQAAELAADVSEPGVYRVEARLETFGRERTWILSNPIYLR